MRITRLTDYGVVLLTYFAREATGVMHNARDLALMAHLPLPTVSKVLKVLARNGFLIAHRGAKGGYSLAKRPQEITVAQVVDAVEGHLAITKCSDDVTGNCELLTLCPVQNNWQRITVAVQKAMESITLADMCQPLRLDFAVRGNVQTLGRSTTA